MIRVFLTGSRQKRTPLGYRWLAPLWEAEITLVDHPGQADLCVVAHCLDLVEEAHVIVPEWRLRRLPLVWLSEEPFWDTIWGRDPLADRLIVETAMGPLPLIQLNHQTSDIFRFSHLPYYLLTNPRFLTSYRRLFARNAALSPSDWRAAFAARQTGTAFMFERRPEAYHDVLWPEGDVQGLCAWRSRLAEACADPHTERLGASWGRGPSRFNLGNWHADKLALLDNRARQIGAFENTHQPDYITEKIFDAFACGARPLYSASPDHRLHGFGLPQLSWSNCYDAGLADIACPAPPDPDDRDFFEAFAAAQARLQDMVTPEAEAAERDRLRRAVITALGACLTPPGN